MAENGPDNAEQLKNLAGSRPSSAARGGTMHWFAYLGPNPPIFDEEDRETRLRNLKERQNEERQKKLDEIKAQALAAQRYKEQKEQERKQRFEELRVREDSRRQQVEERKRAINEAERDRLDAILRRNQEREARIEARKRNDRHSMVFAFGSSTPRMLEPPEAYGSFWGHRRATSTQNITCMAAPLTRRQSERELDGGSKKRATSAGGLERSGDDFLRMSSSMYEIFGYTSGQPNMSLMTRSTSAHFGATTPPTTPAGCASGYVGRRRTDLMPTIPTGSAASKDHHQHQPHSPSSTPSQAGSASRLNFGGKSFARSPAPSRPGSALSQQSTSSITSSVHMRTRPVAAPRRPRPASIAGTGITSATQAAGDKTTKPPLPKSRKPSLVKSQDKLKKRPTTATMSSSMESTPKTLLSPTTAENPIAKDTKLPKDNFVLSKPQPEEQSVAPLVDMEIKVELKQVDIMQVSSDNIITDNTTMAEKITLSTTPIMMESAPDIPITNSLIDIEPEMNVGVALMDAPLLLPTPPAEEPNVLIALDEPPKMVGNHQGDGDATGEMVDMTASMIKVRITTEEEAKAALAERRRLAREEAERLAEMERLRIEAENRAELERQQREEDQQRMLIEQMRASEQERLEEAIKETQRRDEEERLRREEENRQKVLKEEADRKAREEAEKQKAELAERLKHEEKEREARRKRVEAIMLRTRGKNNGTPQQTDEKNQENTDQLNGSKSEHSENGHKNGKEIDTVDNIIPVETLKNANTVNVDTISTDDALNSNNSWQHNNQQSDLLM